MCRFKNCDGVNRCLLADISPCPEYEIAMLRAETEPRMARRSRVRSGFTDMDRLMPVQPIGRRNKAVVRAR